MPKHRLFADGEPESVVRIAIKAGWWSLTSCTITAFLQYWGFTVPKGCSLVRMLYLAAKEFMKCDNPRAVSYAHVRIATKSDKSQLLRELLEIDEAIHVLDRDDVQGVQQAQKAAITELEDMQAMVNEYFA